jgi:hypothetical protein
MGLGREELGSHYALVLTSGQGMRQAQARISGSVSSLNFIGRCGYRIYLLNWPNTRIWCDLVRK